MNDAAPELDGACANGRYANADDCLFGHTGEKDEDAQCGKCDIQDQTRRADACSQAGIFHAFYHVEIHLGETHRKVGKRNHPQKYRSISDQPGVIRKESHQHIWKAE